MPLEIDPGAPKKKSFETEIISKENFEMSKVFTIFVGQFNR